MHALDDQRGPISVKLYFLETRLVKSNRYSAPSAKRIQLKFQLDDRRQSPRVDVYILYLSCILLLKVALAFEFSTLLAFQFSKLLALQFSKPLRKLKY